MTDLFDPCVFQWLAFSKEGKLTEPQAEQHLRDAIAGDITDVVILSHGWKNDEGDATKLYGTLWGNTIPHLGTLDLTKVVVCGVLWPAKAYRPDFDQGAPVRSAIRALGDVQIDDLAGREFDSLLTEAMTFFEDAGLAALARDAAARKPGSAERLFDRLNGLVGPEEKDGELREQRAGLLPDDPQSAFAAMSTPPSLNVPEATGRVLSASLGGLAAGLWNGSRAATARILNQFTYYEMKQRAGVIGTALGLLLTSLKTGQRVRLHLVGHSFGARLVTAAANAYRSEKGSFELRSLTLLQGAFSHNALSITQSGVYNGVIGRVSGPICVTHTRNDWATSIAYALASRLSRDTTKAIGDAGDRFGAMGGNGALHLAKEAYAPPFEAAAGFAPAPGKVNNFLADGYIVATSDVDAHNNVTGPECGELVAAGLTA